MNLTANDILIRFTVFVMVMVFAIPLHEMGHAAAAELCGDDIPALQGRVTPEPWVHWDPVGSMLVALTLFSGAPVIGWGKPVATDPTSYRNGRAGAVFVAIAGVLVNLLLAGLGAGIYHFLRLGAAGDPVYTMVCRLFVAMNLSLAIFNLVPVPPLDGSKLVLWLLPGETAIRLERRLQWLGVLILLVFIALEGRPLAIPVDAATRLLLGR